MPDGAHHEHVGCETIAKPPPHHVRDCGKTQPVVKHTHIHSIDIYETAREKRTHIDSIDIHEGAISDQPESHEAPADDMNSASNAQSSEHMEESQTQNEAQNIADAGPAEQTATTTAGEENEEQSRMDDQVAYMYACIC